MNNKLKSKVQPVRNLTPAVMPREGGHDAMKDRMITLQHVIDRNIKIINGLITRNGGRGLINELLSYVRAIYPRSTKSVAIQVVCFCFLLNKLVRGQGMKGAVLYLKACQVLLQQAVGGYRVSDLSDLKMRPKRTRSGIPQVIPAGVRVRIQRDRHIPTIKLGMTLFGFYRIMSFPGKLNLGTITNPGVNLNRFMPEWEKFVSGPFIYGLRQRVTKGPKLDPLTIFPIAKSGPTSAKEEINTSVCSLQLSARLGLRMRDLKDAMQIVSTGLGAPALVNRMELVAMSDSVPLDKGPSEAYFPSDHNPTVKSLKRSGTGFLGKLGFKEEPAGKIRVFAMVDAWTQGCLSPLHKFIFKILRNINDNDGTFDQLRPLKAFQLKYASNAKGRTFSSIDLSAATDRLPIRLQKTVLQVILLNNISQNIQMFVNAWEQLMVGRAYKFGRGKALRSVLYAVGQPMGALSSGAMLAITHHAIVQLAAYRVGFRNWFADYAVLGDDIVIMNGNVANAYRQILSTIGVGAGLAKSIIAKSKFVVEFAKKFFVDSGQANMLPIKECVATRCSTSLIIEFVRKYSLSLNAILSFLGFGYKVKSRVIGSDYYKLNTRLRVILVWLSHPTSPLGISKEVFNYPYAAGLLQRSWHRSFQTVELETLMNINDLLKEKLSKKIAKVNSDIRLYEKSVHETVTRLNKTCSIMIQMQNLPGSNNQWDSKQEFSGSNILHPDFSERSIVNVDYMADGVSDLDRRDDHQRVGPLEHMRDFRLIAFGRPTLNESSTDFMDVHINELSLLEAQLKEYFKGPPTEMIPEQWGSETRKEEKPYRDFLSTYALWQELSKEVGANYYRSKKNVKQLSERGKQKVKKNVSSDKDVGTALQLVPYRESPVTLIEIPQSGLVRKSHLMTPDVIPLGNYKRLTDFFVCKFSIREWVPHWVRGIIWSGPYLQRDASMFRVSGLLGIFKEAVIIFGAGALITWALPGSEAEASELSDKILEVKEAVAEVMTSDREFVSELAEPYLYVGLSESDGFVCAILILMALIVAAHQTYYPDTPPPTTPEVGNIVREVPIVERLPIETIQQDIDFARQSAENMERISESLRNLNDILGGFGGGTGSL